MKLRFLPGLFLTIGLLALAMAFPNSAQGQLLSPKRGVFPITSGWMAIDQAVKAEQLPAPNDKKWNYYNQGPNGWRLVGTFDEVGRDTQNGRVLLFDKTLQYRMFGTASGAIVDGQQTYGACYMTPGDGDPIHTTYKLNGQDIPLTGFGDGNWVGTLPFSMVYPPRLRDFGSVSEGVEWCLANRAYAGPKTTYQTKIPLSEVVVGDSDDKQGGYYSYVWRPRPFPVAVTTYYQWVQVSAPTLNTIPKDVTVTQTFSSSLSDLDSFSTRLGLTVEAGADTSFGSFKATVTKEVEKARQVESTYSTSNEKSWTYKAEANTWTVAWNLQRVVEYKYLSNVSSTLQVINNQPITDYIFYEGDVLSTAIFVSEQVDTIPEPAMK